MHPHYELTAILPHLSAGHWVGTVVLVYGVSLFLFLPGLCVKALAVARVMMVTPAVAFRVAAAAHAVSGLLAVPVAWVSITIPALVILLGDAEEQASSLRELLEATIAVGSGTLPWALGMVLFVILAASTVIGAAADYVFFRWLLADRSQAVTLAAVWGNVLSHSLLLSGVVAVFLQTQLLGR